MGEIGGVIQHLGSLPQILGFFLIIYLILRSPAGLLIAKKLTNGGSKEHHPKPMTAGDAPIEFWDTRIRTTMQDVVDAHERDEAHRYDDLGRRYGDLRDALKEMTEAQRDAAKEFRDGVTRIVDAIHSRRAND